MMRGIKKYVPQSTLKKIYNAIVLSHLDFCSLVWDNCSEYNLHKLQKLNRGARVITGRTYETSSKDVLKELIMSWQPLIQRFKRNKLIFMHKIKNDSVTQSLTEMLKINENKIYNPCDNKNFVLDKPKTNFMKMSISCSGAHLWNNLPTSSKDQNVSLNRFNLILDRN